MSLGVVTKQLHITWTIISESDPGNLLYLNWKSLRQNDSRLPDASNCHKGLHVRSCGFWVAAFVNRYVVVGFDLIWYAYLKSMYTDLQCKTL